MLCRNYWIAAAMIGLSLGGSLGPPAAHGQGIAFPGSAPPASTYAQPPIGFGNPQPVYPSVTAPAMGAPPVNNAYPWGPPVVGTGVPAYYTQPQQPAFDPFYFAPGSTGGFEAGFQAAFLEVQTGNVVPVPAVFPNNGVTFTSLPIASYDLTFSPRFWAGVQFAGGFGFRGRYWHYDATGSSGAIAGPTANDFVGDTSAIITGLNGVPNPAYDTINFSAINLNTNVKIDAIDAEFSQEGRLDNWEFEVAGGVRYAQIRFSSTSSFNANFIDTPFLPFGPLPPLVIPVTATTSSKFDGIGPTVDFFARRSLGFWEGLSFVMDARASFLFGETNVTSSGTGSGGTALLAANAPSINGVTRQPIQIWELKVGLDYTYVFQNGGEIHLGAFLEGQIWEWPLSLQGAPGGDIGFIGPTAFIEYTH